MDAQRILDLFLFTIPSLITGVIAYYFFREHTRNEDGRRRFLLKKDLQVTAMPLRLQAYERMALFLERIAPSKLLIRTAPLSSTTPLEGQESPWFYGGGPAPPNVL